MTGPILKRAATIVPGQAPPSDRVQDFSGGLPFIQGNAEFGAFFPLPRLQCLDPPKEARAGDILLSVRAPVGALNVAEARLGIGRGIAAIRANRDVDSRFLRYALISVIPELQARSTGTTFLAVSADQIGTLDLPQVVPEEQRRIADFLDDQVARIDNIIAARGRQLALLYRLFGAELTAAVFGDGAPTIPLGYVALVEHGRQRSPENQSGPYMTPYVRSANVTDGLVDLSELLEMNFTPAEQNTYALRYGDVLVTEASGSVDAIGASARWTEYLARTVCFQNHLLRVRPRSGAADASFLYWWARASYHSGAMRVWATGANILNLGSEALRGMPVPRLTINQQASTGRRAELVAERYVTGREVLRRQLDRLQELKRSLITAAVTGEFDVSTAVGSGVPV